ncbi:amino acid permease [Colletotrichum higginsianum]|uniref:Amino acid permease n=2 Tax=Colletotrichum higginsianum TaxID=80884 RepID=H1VYI1_COLHI|nr:Amino acid permease [Colletotrichum higginsianum IMI 349063]OBR10766.1 Amino acid permease [Colletotrichum higginsianum IMI 349063]TID07146.1 Amino-acid permease inda1 [Colletotrichum higginsianum]GJD00992.1 amino acid permease [Colletotrichum higginsianum]CCF45293.1 amino acid permease [Colletotrichum higginsianum]
MGTEKDVHDGVSTPETTQINTDSRHGAGTEHVVGGGTSGRDENFYTRNGLNMESFKRREHGRITDTQLDRTMKSRHLHMIAIGGSIGAGFFVGSGGALATGGPGSILVDFSIIGIMMFNVVYALGELAVMYPVSGGFYVYSTRFIDPSWGFAMGWNYVFQWAIVLPLELTVCGLTINYWEGARDISLAVWITVFWVAIIFINIFGTLGYAEEEFWSSLLKLSAIVIFMIVALVLVCGGGPAGGRYDEYWGARYWHDPGAFKNGFKGFCAVFVTAAFSFAGTELVGLAAAESSNPLKSLPGAIKQVFWRITLFYILGLFFVGLLISSNDERILGSDNPYADGVSPFVLTAEYAGLIGYNHFMNCIILVSVLSLGVSCVYGGSRTLTALAEQGYAPKIFAYVDKSGRPLPSVAVHLLCGALGYMNLSADGSTVFDWLLAMSAIAALFTWGSICLAHIRFRKAWAYHGHTVDEIPFQAAFGVAGSWVGLILCILVLIAQLFVAIAPAGQDELNDAAGFFEAYLTVPVILVFWVIGYFWKREGWLRTHQMDVDTGRRELDWDEINRYKAEVATWPTWKRLYNRFF